MSLLGVTKMRGLISQLVVGICHYIAPLIYLHISRVSVASLNVTFAPSPSQINLEVSHLDEESLLVLLTYNSIFWEFFF